MVAGGESESKPRLFATLRVTIETFYTNSIPLGKGIDISTEGNLPDDLDGGRPRIRPADVGIDWKSTPFSERNPSGFE